MCDEIVFALSSPCHLLCLLGFPSAIATFFALQKEGQAIILFPRGWARRIQVSDVVRRVSNCCCSVLFKHPQFIAVGCKVATISPQILVVPLPALLKKGEMVRAVSP